MATILLILHQLLGPIISTNPFSMLVPLHPAPDAEYSPALAQYWSIVLGVLVDGSLVSACCNDSSLGRSVVLDAPASFSERGPCQRRLFAGMGAVGVAPPGRTRTADAAQQGRQPRLVCGRGLCPHPGREKARFGGPSHHDSSQTG